MSPFLLPAVGVAVVALLVLAFLRLAGWVAEEPTSCRPRRTVAVAKRLDASDGGEPSLLAFELVSPSTLRAGDLVACWCGDLVPGGGMAVQGSAVVSLPGFPRSGRRMVARGDRVPGGLDVRRGHLIVLIADSVDTSSRDAIRAHGPHPRITRQPASSARALRP